MFILTTKTGILLNVHFFDDKINEFAINKIGTPEIHQIQNLDITMEIEGKNVNIELVTGTAVSTISEKLKTLWSNL